MVLSAADATGQQTRGVQAMETAQTGARTTADGATMNHSNQRTAGCTRQDPQNAAATQDAHGTQTHTHCRTAK